eukprot:s199_g22.t1
MADMEQSSSTDVKVVQTGAFFAQRPPSSVDARVVQTEMLADLEECPSTDGKLVHAQFVVQSEQHPMVSAVAVDPKAAVHPCSAESLPVVDTLVTPGTASRPPLQSGGAEELDELVSTSEMKFVQCLAGKVEAAARVKQARQAPSQRLPAASPWYAIDLEAQVVRPLSAKPAAKPPRVPQAPSASGATGSARLHAKLMRQAEAARSRVAQSDITLRQLKDAAHRSPSKPASPRRCPWHGSGAAAVSGVAPLYYEGPDCEFTSSALLSLEASLDEIGR